MAKALARVVAAMAVAAMAVVRGQVTEVVPLEGMRVGAGEGATAAPVAAVMEPARAEAVASMVVVSTVVEAMALEVWARVVAELKVAGAWEVAVTVQEVRDRVVAAEKGVPRVEEAVAEGPREEEKVRTGGKWAGMMVWVPWETAMEVVPEVVELRVAAVSVVVVMGWVILGKEAAAEVARVKGVG